MGWLFFMKRNVEILATVAGVAFLLGLGWLLINSGSFQLFTIPVIVAAAAAVIMVIMDLINIYLSLTGKLD